MGKFNTVTFIKTFLAKVIFAYRWVLCRLKRFFWKILSHSFPILGSSGNLNAFSIMLLFMAAKNGIIFQGKSTWKTLFWISHFFPPYSRVIWNMLYVFICIMKSFVLTFQPFSPYAVNCTWWRWNSYILAKGAPAPPYQSPAGNVLVFSYDSYVEAPYCSLYCNHAACNTQ